MVRVGSLYDQSLILKDKRDNKTNMTSDEQINAILNRVKLLDNHKDTIYQKNMEEIEKYGIKILNFNNLLFDEQAFLENYFSEEIEPLISPMVIGRNQPFPFLNNKEIYAVTLLKSVKGKEKIGLIKCSNSLFKRLIEIPYREGYYMLSEELILHFIQRVFKHYKLISKSLIKVTRNADIDADSLHDEDLDYRDMMLELIKQRKKLSPVKLEISRDIDISFVEILTRNLGIKKKQTFIEKAPLDLSFMSEIRDMLRHIPNLFYEKQKPQQSAAINCEEKLIPQIMNKDILLSYPYESIKPFINLLNESANDKDVLSIKMTLYRVAKQSKIVEALVDAAENGKEVIVLVKLRARFDEENNIEWSRRLEDAGCKVIYGIEGYKVHTKLCLITRKCDKGINYIVQVGTGNYNEKTACLYTDLSLMTSNENIGKEVNNIFKKLMISEFVEDSTYMLIAPKCFQNRIIELIDNEINNAKDGKEAYIGIKINSLTDKLIIDKLIEASMANVKIELVVRGISCLVSNIKGYTYNIKIISIVSRFLEHSRIYIFGCGDREKVFIGSADFMTRNTTKRVEAAVPILDKNIKERIKSMFNVMLKDNKKAIVNIGSNSMRIVMYEVDEKKYKKLIDEKNFSGLITEIKKEKMTDIGLSKMCYFLNYARELCRIADCNDISCFATSAMRKVKNKEEIVALVKLKTGITVEILSEEEETTYDSISVLSKIGNLESVALDMGGGSCQIFKCNKGKLLEGDSFEIGSLYLYDKFVKGLIPNEKESKAIKRHVKEALSKCENLNKLNYKEVYVFGGTMRAIYKLYDAMPCNSNKSKGMVKDSLYKAISVKEIKEMIDEIYDLNINGINILCHVIPERVYTIIPGMIAIKQICNYLGTKKIRLIDASVREGYLINSL